MHAHTRTCHHPTQLWQYAVSRALRSSATTRRACSISRRKRFDAISQNERIHDLPYTRHQLRLIFTLIHTHSHTHKRQTPKYHPPTYVRQSYHTTHTIHNHTHNAREIVTDRTRRRLRNAHGTTFGAKLATVFHSTHDRSARVRYAPPVRPA